ncbi:tRNA modification GTPase gtpbp3, mitochondrial [Mortierella sp. GBA30]|nr:tRNA modification GTPase gtpbp3, mitochondrial [Mortierella sp. GBA30]
MDVDAVPSTTVLATAAFESNSVFNRDFKPNEPNQRQQRPSTHQPRSDSNAVAKCDHNDIICIQASSFLHCQEDEVSAASAMDFDPARVIQSNVGSKRLSSSSSSDFPVSALSSVSTRTVEISAPTSSSVALEPSAASSPNRLQGQETTSNSKDVASSSISILSASATLTPDPASRRRSILTPSRPAASRATTAHTTTTIVTTTTSTSTSTATAASVQTPFDAQLFKSIMHELSTHIDRFEELSDQVLDAMTGHDEGRLGLGSLSPLSSSGAEPKEKEKGPKDLEEERRTSAQTITDLISTAWPRLYQPCATNADTQVVQGQAQTQFHQTSKITKQQAKSATVLKSAIVTFWSAQSNFQERAQLVLDIYEDPAELEREDRIRSLRSRHLNNLLASTLSPTEVAQLKEKFQTDQDRMVSATEPLRAVWLGIIILLEEHGKAGKTGESSLDGEANETLTRRLMRLGRNKGLALKNLVKSCNSSNVTPLQPTELRYTDTHLDTIFALSTHPGKAGIAVIRISGPQAKTVLRSMTRVTSSLPKPRHAVTRRLMCPQTNELLDKGMVIWFPGPRSFTGEDSVEFHCHGGRAVVDSLLRSIGSVGQHGGLKNLYDSWRTQLIQSMALIEALIDFGEDENIEDDVYDNVVAKVKSLYSEIKRHTNDDRCGEILRDGIHVTILGPPNAGKSSFLNYITKRQAAIVSPIPGTTRDVVEVSLDIGGYPILIGDTAGLRTSQDEIEMEGVRRAQNRIKLADINVAILPVTDFLAGSERATGSNSVVSPIGLDPIVLDAIRKNPKTMVLINKMDISGLEVERTMAKIRSLLWQETGDGHVVESDKSVASNHRLWAISCQTGEGIESFLDDFTKILKERFETSFTSSTSITQYRHRKHLENCLQSLEAFLGLGVDDVVLGAEELRHAASDLGRITGRVDVEEVLDVVFREFCIGK